MLSATPFGKLLNIIDLFLTRSHQYDRLQGRLGKASFHLSFLISLSWITGCMKKSSLLFLEKRGYLLSDIIVEIEIPILDDTATLASCVVLGLTNSDLSLLTHCLKAPAYIDKILSRVSQTCEVDWQDHQVVCKV